MVIIFSRHHLVWHVFRFFFNLLLISFTFYLEKLVKSMIHLGEIPGKMAIEGEIVRYFFFYYRHLPKRSSRVDSTYKVIFLQCITKKME
jgi:hypothetical protein